MPKKQAFLAHRAFKQIRIHRPLISHKTTFEVCRV
jgi:hypothetical protein